MPDCSSLTETPSAQQIIGPNHCRSSGFNTCHMRRCFCKSPAISAAKQVYRAALRTYIGRRRPADAATAQLSARRAAESHRHPHCATGSITHCLQWRCSGSSMSERLCSGDSVRGLSTSEGERDVYYRELFQREHPRLPPARPLDYMLFIYITRPAGEPGSHECVNGPQGTITSAGSD